MKLVVEALAYAAAKEVPSTSAGLLSLPPVPQKHPEEVTKLWEAVVEETAATSATWSRFTKRWVVAAESGVGVWAVQSREVLAATPKA